MVQLEEAETLASNAAANHLVGEEDTCADGGATGALLTVMVQLAIS